MPDRIARLAAALAAATALAPGAQAQTAAPFPRRLDQYISASLRHWEVPGAAVAVVKDGQVVLARGYGARELGGAQPVDASTVFDLASLTKAFTAAAIGALVDDSTLAWDDPVIRFLPRLAFPDPYLTAHVTLRDLLSHRTGLAAHNRAAFSTGFTRAELLETVARMRVAGPFRAWWNYSNVGYTIAGEAAAVASGRPWEQLVAERLLSPLGMTCSTADVARVAALDNVAVGHAMFGGVQRPVPRVIPSRLVTAPAGAVHACARDLATWMLFQLGDGTFNGRRILSADVMAEMHAPQVVVPTTAAFRAARQLKYFAAYGFGWQIFDYHGSPMLWHSGLGDGQRAYLALLPEERLGIAVVVNSWKAGVPLNAALANSIIDHYLGRPARDHVAEWRAAWTAAEERRADDERTLSAARRRGTAPSLPLPAYAGTFSDDLGLSWFVRLDGDTLLLQYQRGDVAALAHWHHDTFRARWRNPLHADDGERPLFVSFGISARGAVERLFMDPGPFGESVTALRVQ